MGLYLVETLTHMLGQLGCWIVEVLNCWIVVVVVVAVAVVVVVSGHWPSGDSPWQWNIFFHDFPGKNNHHRWGFPPYQKAEIPTGRAAQDWRQRLGQVTLSIFFWESSNPRTFHKIGKVIGRQLETWFGSIPFNHFNLNWTMILWCLGAMGFW